MPMESGDVSPDGRYLAIEGHSIRWPRERLINTRDEVEILDIATSKSLKKTTVSEYEWEQVAIADADPIQERFLRYTGDGTRLLFSDATQRKLRVLRADDLSQIHEFPEPNIALGFHIWAIGVAARAPIAAAVWGGSDLRIGRSVVAFYDLDQGRTLGSVLIGMNTNLSASSIALSPDGRLAALNINSDPGGRLGNKAHDAIVISVPDGKLVTTMIADYVIRPVAFDADGRVLTAAGSERTKSPQVKVWDAPTGHFITQLEGIAGGINGALAVSADGKRAVGLIRHQKYEGGWWRERTFRSADEGFVIWDTKSGAVQATSPLVTREHSLPSELRMSNSQIVLMYGKGEREGHVYRCH